MPMITPNALIRQLPVAELQESLETFLAPLTEQLPDARLPTVARLMVQGIVTSESPLVTQIARGTREPEQSVLMSSKRGIAYWRTNACHTGCFSKGCMVLPSAPWRTRRRRSRAWWWQSIR